MTSFIPVPHPRSLPCGEGGGGFGSRCARAAPGDYAADTLDDARQLVDDFDVREAQYRDAGGPEAVVSACIVIGAFVMHRAIDLDGEVAFGGEEVDDVTEKRALSSERHAGLPYPKLTPEHMFFHRHPST